MASNSSTKSSHSESKLWPTMLPVTCRWYIDPSRKEWTIIAGLLPPTQFNDLLREARTSETKLMIPVQKEREREYHRLKDGLMLGDKKGGFVGRLILSQGPNLSNSEDKKGSRQDKAATVPLLPSCQQLLLATMPHDRFLFIDGTKDSSRSFGLYFLKSDGSAPTETFWFV